MRKFSTLFISLFVIVPVFGFSQTGSDSLFTEQDIVLKTATGNISGSLTVPNIQGTKIVNYIF